MKVSITILAAILALTTVVLTNHSALAKGGVVCQKKPSFADGYGATMSKARAACTGLLQKKGQAKFGNLYTGLGSFSKWCDHEGPDVLPSGEVNKKAWVCICSGHHCSRIKLQIPPPSQSFRQKPDRDPEFGPSPGRYLDMPNLGRFPGMGRGISPSRPRR